MKKLFWYTLYVHCALLTLALGMAALGCIPLAITIPAPWILCFIPALILGSTGMWLVAMKCADKGLGVVA
jgi:hypothetical protein